MRASPALVALLAGLLFASALASVYVQHQRRTLFVELQRLERERDAKAIEWGRLKLEQSTWATHDRIARLARQELDLRTPPADDVVLVTP